MPRSTRPRKRIALDLFAARRPVRCTLAKLGRRAPDEEDSAMHKWYGGGLFALASLLLPGMLAGCAEQRAGLSTADAVTRLRTGAPMLTCREACVADWRRAQPQAAQLDAAGSWPELAALVIGTGYQ